MTLDYADIQGTILQGYRADHARHFVLRVLERFGAQSVLGSLVDGTPGMPQITTAERWTRKPSYFLNVGITAAGLAALGQPIAGFPAAFLRGATDAYTTSLVGDVGPSAPANWFDGLSDAAGVHLILSLWVADDPAVREEVSAALLKAFGSSIEVLATQDADALADNKVHFGYTDNISQPTVAGAPPPKRPRPDAQPVAPTGEFLLGYETQNPGGQIYEVTPAVLSQNSSFAAFRLLEQDVAGFDAWLTAGAAQAQIDREALAAKVCGRWRNGVPLELSPDTPTPEPPLAPEQINDYTYVASGDTFGYTCPIGAHMRRANPRDAAVIGGGHLHRIVRRAMPYGPPFDPDHADDVPRGLVGWFINADIANQFELVMSQWVNGSTFVMSAPGTDKANPVWNISGEDVILGTGDPGSFTLPNPPNRSANTTLTGFGPFVTTRGGAYCYLPSMTALRYIANLVTGVAGGVDEGL